MHSCKRYIIFVLLTVFLLFSVGCEERNIDLNLPTEDGDTHTANSGEEVLSEETDFGTHAGDLSDGSRWFDGEVLEVADGSIRVMPAIGTWERESARDVGLIVSLYAPDEEGGAYGIGVGDTVRVTYDGLIATSSPGQILQVRAIDVLQRDADIRTEIYDGVNE